MHYNLNAKLVLGLHQMINYMEKFVLAYICASVGGAIRNYKSKPDAPSSMLSSSLFIHTAIVQ